VHLRRTSEINNTAMPRLCLRHLGIRRFSDTQTSTNNGKSIKTLTSAMVFAGKVRSLNIPAMAQGFCQRATLITCLLIFFGALPLCGVVSTDAAEFARLAKTNVRKGMSKSQVRSILGKPLTITSYDSTENWHYSKFNVARGLVCWA
jgi:hypothetical protein